MHGHAKISSGGDEMRTFKNQSSTGSCVGRVSRQRNFRHNTLVARTDPSFKQLLVDTEKINLLREDLTLGAICRLRPSCCNAGNEKLKKKHKSDLNQIKRRTKSAHITLLDLFSIAASLLVLRSSEPFEKSVFTQEAACAGCTALEVLCVFRIVE